MAIRCSFLSLALVTLVGCASPSQSERIIALAREAHGSEVLNEAAVTFDFRGEHFSVRRDGGTFTNTRSYFDSTGTQIVEVLENDTLFRTIGGVRQNLSDRERRGLQTDVNSVVYFALLPYNLADPAVLSEYLGESVIDGEPYHEIEVTFRQEGGGRDWEDRFVYWIHQEDHTVDFLAYDYQTGTRFRQAVNPRKINGVRFVDYLNFTSDTLTAIENYERELAADGLRKVSEIRLENIQVRPLSASE